MEVYELEFCLGELRISSFRKSAYLRRVCTRFCSVLIFLFRRVPSIFSLLVSFLRSSGGLKIWGRWVASTILVAGRLEQVGVLRRRGVFVCIQDLSRVVVRLW